jgi:hypothetical protein
MSEFCLIALTYLFLRKVMTESVTVIDYQLVHTQLQIIFCDFITIVDECRKLRHTFNYV